MASRSIEVTIGQSADAKCYTVHYSDSGEVTGIEAMFYGYLGRLTYRPLKKNGATWRKVLAHCDQRISGCAVHHLAHPCEACAVESQYVEVGFVLIERADNEQGKQAVPHITRMEVLDLPLGRHPLYVAREVD